MIKGVLFDLDGTLVDTAPDLAAALNHTLATEGRPTMTLAEIRPHVSNGSVALINFGFDIEESDDPDYFACLRQLLLDAYMQNIATHSQLFPGMADLLQQLEDRGAPWGVVTNKPAYLTEPLMQALHLADRSSTTISGDTLPQRKPDPEPLYLASQQIGIAPQHLLYIGDAERDIIAGRSAGMQTLIASYGYIDSTIDTTRWQASGLVADAGEIGVWIDAYNALSTY